MRRKIPVAALVAACAAMALPSLASASTPTPALSSGATQAYIANNANVPQAGSLSVAVPITFNGAYPMDCSSKTLGLSYTTAGTATVTSFVTAGCSVPGYSGCTLTIAADAGSLPWGARLEKKSGAYALSVNAALGFTFGLGCPVPANTYSETGLLRPAISVSSGVLSAVFNGGTGSLNGGLGSMTLNGTATGTLPAGSTKLIG
jgi:hypothetical protein